MLIGRVQMRCGFRIHSCRELVVFKEMMILMLGNEGGQGADRQAYIIISNTPPYRDKKWQ